MMSITDDDFEMDDDYLEEVEKLMETIEKREEMLKLLKVARLRHIPEIRECIAGLDKSIEATEHILELQAAKLRQEKILEEQLDELMTMTDQIEIEMREHLKKNKPEKLEMFEAMMSDDGTSH